MRVIVCLSIYIICISPSKEADPLLAFFNAEKKEVFDIARGQTSKYNIAHMIKIIREYTDDSDLPILKECCYQNDWVYDSVMQIQQKHEDLREEIKRLLMKKEVCLERGVHAGKLKETMAIFTLKQPAHGWKDKPKEDEEDNTLNLLSSVLDEVKKQSEVINQTSRVRQKRK